MDHSHQTLSAALNRISWGYFLLLFNFNLGPVNLLPAWLGLYLIYLALPVLGQWQPAVLPLRPVTCLLGWCDGLVWLCALFGLTELPPLLALLVQVANIVLHFRLLSSMADLADGLECPQGRSLRILRNIYLLMLTLSALPIPWETIAIHGIPILSSDYLLLVIGVIVLFFIILLITIHNLRTAVGNRPDPTG